MGYQFQVISGGYITFSSQKYDSFIDLANNTDFDFDRLDYEILVYYDGKLLNILR